MEGLTGIHKVNWGQVGRVMRPDRYEYSYGWLTIAAEDVAVWEVYPDALFTLVNVRSADSMDEYRLGTFELR